ncbi:MAG: PHP domain-containing protein [Thiotrichaceae bacterium]|nr:PHP domain-containing protein [Thiotrichaceae bacterium]PCI12273.1 MAG: phosphatase [Thiotrichales bacterium]
MGNKALPSICYDLHSHSTASDGVLSPTELVLLAAENGVDVLALTDHDSTDGHAEAAQATAVAGIRFIPGIEISVSWRKRLIHIVGLKVNSDYAEMQAGLAELRTKRERRAVEIGVKFEKIGMPDVYDGARSLASGVLSRSHFAMYLVEKGVVKDVQQAFKKYLQQGKRCYVGAEWASLEDALSWIHGAGGQAVVAHPARYKMSRTLFREFLKDFKALGGEGIEVACSSHNLAEATLMAGYAQELGLLASAGSDFHSPHNSWAKLGRVHALPEGCTPIWQGWD